jgi:hypothetical protein
MPGANCWSRRRKQIFTGVSPRPITTLTTWTQSLIPNMSQDLSHSTTHQVKSHAVKGLTLCCWSHQYIWSIPKLGCKHWSAGSMRSVAKAALNLGLSIAGATAASVCASCAPGTYSGSSGAFQLPLRACTCTAEQQGLARAACSVTRAWMRGWIWILIHEALTVLHKTSIMRVGAWKAPMGFRHVVTQLIVGLLSTVTLVMFSFHGIKVANRGLSWSVICLYICRSCHFAPWPPEIPNDRWSCSRG